MNRWSSAGAAAVVIAFGLASRAWPAGNHLWDKSLGDVAYAALIGLLVAFVRPRTRPIVIALLAIAISFAVETFQLTGIAARAPRVVQILLGTTFAWHDMACYVVGGAAAGVLARISVRGAPRGSPAT